MQSIDINNVGSSTKNAFDEQKKYFPTQLQAFQYLDKYSRYNYNLGRREVWEETVDRAVNFLKEISHNKLPSAEYNELKQAILKMQISPAMRLLAMGGEAARRQNLSIFNCSFVAIDCIDAIVEELIISLAGCGVGFSVEKQFVEKLPMIEKYIENQAVPYHEIEDSTEGWVEAFRLGLNRWFAGRDVRFGYDKIRRAGTPLKIKGGRASGPKPLRSLLDFARKIILSRQEQKLRPIDVHDIICKLGESVVSGGVRRTAEISLFDINDVEMRNCKNGDNIIGNEHRYMANNSAIWDEKITNDQIRSQFEEMHKGLRGEPGVVSRHNANKLAPERRKRFGYQYYGTNPCGEIALRSAQLCNLSIANVRPKDTLETLMNKVRLATICGTLQACATNFPGMRDIWKINTAEEALLGVDLNGTVDNKILQLSNPGLPKILETLKNCAIETNQRYAKLLGINPASAITCNKPAGNSSILFDTSSGLHTRWAKYYIRNIRIQTESPLRKLMADQGVPMEPENNQLAETANTWVCHFPVKAPEGALTRHDVDAISQCEYWLMFKKHWCEHNPSVTITYKNEELEKLIEWVIKHKNWIGGMSFLPASNSLYKNMPLEEITKEDYDKLNNVFPKIDFSLLPTYEKKDMTESSSELACMGGSCELSNHQSLKEPTINVS